MPAILSALGLMLLSSQPAQRWRSAHRITQIAMAGLDEQDYSVRAAAFGHRVGCDPAWVRAEMVQCLREQQATGR